MAFRKTTALGPWLAVLLLQAVAGRLSAQETNDWRSQIQLLQQQNATLVQQLQRQQTLIENLNRKVSAIEESSGDQKQAAADTTAASGFNFGKLHISGEGGAALFASGPDGMTPNSEFRVDEARLFLDASIWGDVYAHAEVNLEEREDSDNTVRLGEYYLDFEDVSKLWGHERQLNIKAGQFYIPFGEEYQDRFAIDNPLISHSLSDLWGVDEGVELYGSAGQFSYVLAVQNGGAPNTADFNGDKAIVARLGYDPTQKLHLSLSAMRTGDLNAQNDYLSGIWFGNGFVRSLGSPATSKFGAELLEADLTYRLPHGHLKAFGGYLHYHDNDPAADNKRDVYYYSLEAEHRITGGFYGAARFSQIFAHNGFPIVANGDFNDYFFSSLTTQIWRLSLGVGYRFGENLVIKTEYSFERGEEVGGDKRDREDLFATEAAFKF